MGAVFVLCALLTLVFWGPGEWEYVQVLVDGKPLCTLALGVDQQRVVETEFGRNVITVKDGKVAVTQADCPDGYCMARGWCVGGPQIVCLPNRLVIRFLGDTELDAVS